MSRYTLAHVENHLAKQLERPRPVVDYVFNLLTSITASLGLLSLKSTFCFLLRKLRM